ncbi:MAG: prepilin peptidase [Candidatus Eremiobacteraeota bacterium]|nr:prepilin peptidase [Candidatus Eremiobacteraeota bacterium]
MSLWIVALVGLMYGCAAYLGVELSAVVCKNITPFEDGPKPGKPPVALLIAGSVAVGVSLALRGADYPSLGIAALVSVSLVACWYSDVRTGIVPDVFTLAPLGALLLVAGLTHNWNVFFATIGVVVPFSAAAMLSKGRGMGWGDVKLVALGGAALGLSTALIAFSVACFTAAAVALALRRRSEPIAFAPYLAGAIGVAMIFNVF